MKVAIIKYNSGNVYSVQQALLRLGVTPIVTEDANEIKYADKVIFPGVGSAATAMQHIQSVGLDKLIPTLQQPFLGICLGMQLLCKSSEEGHVDCLGVFDNRVLHFSTEEKVPEVGWNNIFNLNTPLFVGIDEEAYVYFVHSYYAELGKNTIAQTDYGIKYSSALHKDNFYGVQFHPEKSGEIGEKILENFIKL